MIPSLKEVFLVREVNVTTVANQYKVPPKFVEYVNSKDRKFADILVKLFVHRYKVTVDHEMEKRPWDTLADPEDTKVKIWKKVFDDFWEVIGEMISKYLNKNPNEKNRIIQDFMRDYRDVRKELWNWREQDLASADDLTKRSAITFPDGFYWVKLNSDECDREGKLMQHCGTLSNSENEMWSLRDHNNKSHVTIEMDSKGNIIQCRGKQNDAPSEKYWSYIEEFCSERGVTFLSWDTASENVDIELALKINKIKKIPGKNPFE